MLVGHEDILLPTTMVGNYPNPRWYDGYAHSRLPPGALVYDSLTREAYEDAILAVVHDQETAGIDIISDGRVHGGDSPYAQVVYHYFERLRGYEIDGPQLGLPIYSTLFAPTVVGEVSRRTSFAMPTLRAVRKATKKPVKISYQASTCSRPRPTTCSTRT
jgi:2-hydroxypropyl-CoM lyase